MIQVPYLTGHWRNNLEKMLSLFDQSRVIENAGKHFMALNEDELSAKYRPLLHRLRRGQEEDIRDVEDDIIAELPDKERLIERLDLTVQEQDKALKEKDKALEEKERIIGSVRKLVG